MFTSKSDGSTCWLWPICPCYDDTERIQYSLDLSVDDYQNGFTFFSVLIFSLYGVSPFLCVLYKLIDWLNSKLAYSLFKSTFCVNCILSSTSSPLMFSPSLENRSFWSPWQDASYFFRLGRFVTPMANSDGGLMSFLIDSYDGNSSIASEGISSETAKVSSVIFNSADSFLAYALG